MAVRKRRGSYLGGSTVVGPGGRWSRSTETDKAARSSLKRFRQSDRAEAQEAERAREVETAREMTAITFAVRQRAAEQAARLEEIKAAAAARKAARAAAFSRVVDRIAAWSGMVIRKLKFGLKTPAGALSRKSTE